MNQCSNHREFLFSRWNDPPNHREFLFSRWNDPPNLRETPFLVGTTLKTYGKFFFSLERPSEPSRDFTLALERPSEPSRIFIFSLERPSEPSRIFIFSLERPSEPTKNFIFLTYASQRQRSKKKSANIVCVCGFFFRCGSRAYEFIESKNSSLSRVCAMRL